MRAQIEAVIRRYFDGCNEADSEKIRSCFVPEAIHYFPAGAPQGRFVGAAAIAEGWGAAVATMGSIWTIDHIAIDEAQHEAVMEWTHFKPRLGTYLRGDEWYRFSEDVLICEIRAYYACPPVDQGRSYELGKFDYAGRGYATEAPARSEAAI
jgi:SnoaL-like domain